MAIENLLHLSYFFAINQTSVFPGFWPLVGILVAMLVAGYVVSAKAGKMPSPMRQVASRLSHAAIVVGWLGLLWMFFRYQTAPYLSWRIWPTLMIIYLLWQVWIVIRFVRVEYPKKIALKEMAGDKEVYLHKYQKRRK